MALGKGADEVLRGDGERMVGKGKKERTFMLLTHQLPLLANAQKSQLAFCLLDSLLTNKLGPTPGLTGIIFQTDYASVTRALEDERMDKRRLEQLKERGVEIRCGLFNPGHVFHI